MIAPDGGNWASIFLGLIGVVTVGVLRMRKWLSRDSVDRAGDGAEFKVINMLNHQLALRDQHTTELLKALDEAQMQICQLRSQVALLVDQVRQLRLQVEMLTGKHSDQ